MKIWVCSGPLGWRKAGRETGSEVGARGRVWIRHIKVGRREGAKKDHLMTEGKKDGRRRRRKRCEEEGEKGQRDGGGDGQECRMSGVYRGIERQEEEE